MILGRKGQGKTTLTKKIISDKNFIVLDVLGEYEFENISNIKTLINRLSEIIDKQDNFQISIKIQSDKILEIVANILWIFAKYYKKEWWLVCEEASIYARNNSNTKILDFAKYGRHFKVNQIYITRNTAEISKQITSQADLIISFNQNEPRHLDVLKQYGFDINKVQNLKKGEFIFVGDSEIIKQIQKLKKEVSNA